MKLWCTDYHSPSRGLSFCIEQTLYTENSEFQRIDIVETPDFGRVMLLDGVYMLGSKDEFVYHEMLSQPALFCHPDPQRVLIIGGGDCGTLSMVLKHYHVQEAVQVEIDEMVTRVSKEYFPQLCTCLSDSRAKLVFEDGIKYLRDHHDSFDVILIDSTDPVGPASGLFLREFYEDCHRALRSDGILCIQSESPWIDPLRDLISQVNNDLCSLFPLVRPYLAAIQTYQAGLWMFQLASKKHDPLSVDAEQRVSQSSINFKYYNPEIHRACFALPQFIKELVKTY